MLLEEHFIDTRTWNAIVTSVVALVNDQRPASFNPITAEDHVAPMLGTALNLWPETVEADLMLEDAKAIARVGTPKEIMVAGERIKLR